MSEIDGQQAQSNVQHPVELTVDDTSDANSIKPESGGPKVDQGSIDGGEASISQDGHKVMQPAESELKALSKESDGLGEGKETVSEEPQAQEQPAGGDVDSERARDIEREASEHLARRASEMTLDSHNEAQDDAVPSATSGGALESPETPPPPMPPRKNNGKDRATQPILGLVEKHAPVKATQSDLVEQSQAAMDTDATGAELQDIMDQFQHSAIGTGEEDIMSSRPERKSSILDLPPRTSSLEAKDSYTITPQTTGQSIASQHSIARSGKSASVSGDTLQRVRSGDSESIMSTKTGSIFQPPPPSPEPEPTLPFDFHRFLEQLRHRTADPVARFLRSFLSEFGKKQWMVHEQVKIISDFLEFISKKMAQCEVWRTVSDAEFDNAREGMEKLVMNRLYAQTFSPAIPAPVGSPRKGGKGGRTQADVANPHGPGRRGQHQEDVERDEVIAQKIRIYGWISEEHLDMKPIGDKGRKFLSLAQQELLKINTYRAPRDKVICVLNTCKVIFGFLKNTKGDQSADAFVPLLIYTVLRARPEHLVSNVQYIWRFRNQDKMGGEAGYYMSSLMGVVTFIENLDRTNLTISDEDFEHQVEQAVSAIAEKNKEEEYEQKAHAAAAAGPMQHLSEKSALSRPEVTSRNSMEAERSSPSKRDVSQRSSEKSQHSSAQSDDDTDAVTGLLRTIQKPLSSIGRMFSDDHTSQHQQFPGLRPALTPQPASTPRALSPVPRTDRGAGGGGGLRPSAERQRSQQRRPEDAAARQASAETAEAQRVRAREHKVVVETLLSMFPNLDKELIEDVTRAQEGNVGRAVDACLALSG